MISHPLGQIAIIPARLKSARFPNKILKEINGIPILNRVVSNVIKTEIFDRVVVATDSLEIVNKCSELGVESFYMEEPVGCGSERAYYVYKKYPNYKHYVTFPADEPMLKPGAITDMWKKHINTTPEIGEYIRTCYSKFYSPERVELNRTCKIVSNQKDYVLYFSRSPIPYSKNGLLKNDEYKKHVGIFIFDNTLFNMSNHGTDILKIWDGPLANKESLEQLAFIENNMKVKLIEIDHKFHGVDTNEDIQNIERLLKNEIFS